MRGRRKAMKARGEERQGGREERGTRRERVEAGSGAVCDAVRHSSMEYTLCCVCSMHLACCVGESVCATSHLLLVLPCRVAVGYATPAARMWLPSVAKRRMDVHESHQWGNPERGFLVHSGPSTQATTQQQNVSAYSSAPLRIKFCPTPGCSIYFVLLIDVLLR